MLFECPIIWPQEGKKVAFEVFNLFYSLPDLLFRFF